MNFNLAYHQARPFVTTRCLQDIPTKDAVTRLCQFMSNDQKADTKPEKDAISFYFLNHAYSTLQLKFDHQEPLNEYNEIADMYFSEAIGEATLRAFYYLLLICTRESRHVHKSNDFHTKLKAKYGQVLHDFNVNLPSGSNGAAQKIKSSPPPVPLGQYTDHLVYTFYKGGFSGGFGGKAWGKVADCLNDFVHGKISAEAMMDTVWTLCHNNGPIFNKEMLYGHYTNDLKIILDVQRAGMMPGLIADYKRGVQYINSIESQHVALFDKAAVLLPEFQDMYVDWDMVEALGSIGKYSHFKSKQYAKHGESPAAKLSQEKAAEAQLAQQKAQEKKLADEQKKWFFITPNQKVEKISRTELVAA